MREMSWQEVGEAPGYTGHVVLALWKQVRMNAGIQVIWSFSG